MTSISDNFKLFLDDFIQKNAPGSRIPAGPELARQTATSRTTVQRILKEYSNKGLIIRIPGRGSFIPGKEETLPPLRTEVEAGRSAESVAETLYAQICDGTFKSGEALPTIKYLTLEWNISRTTAVAAYRLLVERRVIRKLGRQYVAGSPVELAPDPPVKQAVCFYGGEEVSLSNFLGNHPSAFPYKVLEYELMKRNYRFTYYHVTEFRERCLQWLRLKSYPAAVIFPNAKNQTVYAEDYAPYLRRLVDLSGSQCPAIMMGGKITRKKIGGIFYMNPGHLNTDMYREISRYCARRKFKRLVVFYDKSKHRYHDFTYLSTYKLWAEVMQRSPGMDMQYYYSPAGEKQDDSRDKLFRQLHSVGANELISILSKYRKADMDTVRNHVHIRTDHDKLFETARKDDLWVFIHARSAIQMLDHLGQESRGRDDLPSVISLDNDPLYLYRGLSVCVADYLTLGYQMARAILGTHPVSKSSRGYLRAPVMLLHRGTTPA